ncbi:segregation and condensation protein A [Methanofervidicoccus abyssi]|uniref:Segregation and condensation protein A n=1 Tax=Methanofervidicoccus abyssi TaxID=2082189 RepID=A0A401HNS6_9EURY|nr:ScpA family protein [Methanofervidicoccus abyssi]GBF35889.1 segregation and condensation protein A [Methanofervidicoccus abyssi]
MEFELWVRIIKESIQKGNIGPWDINVAKIADEYIKTLKELERFDIRLSADVILVGGILLRMKSQILYEKCEYTFEDDDVEDNSLEDSRSYEDIDESSQKKENSVDNEHLKDKKQFTVDDLIDTLKLELIKVKRNRRKKKDKTENTLYEVIEEMEKYDISKLMENLILELRKEGVIVFQKKFPDRRDKVKNFLPCLYLANEGKVEIFQEDVFKEMVVKYKEESTNKAVYTKLKGL